MGIHPWDEIPETKEAPKSDHEEKVIASLEKSFDVNSNVDDIPEPDYGDIPEKQEVGIPGQFYLTQSLIKQLTDRFGEEKQFCPHNIYHLYVLKDFKTRRSEPMIEGTFGESLILGQVAKNEAVINRLRPNKSTNKPRVAEQRIIMQAERFQHIASIFQINVIPGINVQVPVFKKFGNSVMLRGELDIFPTTIIWDDQLSLAIIDIKFTADVNSTFGEYSWGDTEKVDYIQADFYHYLVRDFDLALNIKHGHEFNSRVGYKNIFTDFVRKVIENNDLKYIYMIFGYKKPDLENQFQMINRTYIENNSDIRERELVQRIRKSIAILSHSHSSGWPKRPNRDICKNCPLNTQFGGPCKEPLKFQNV